ncbi:hypothetical protein N657DRAFT_644250 [Parathielavia appendiculata]|uniref:Uncharacterized protein n=1 Tax=Parathielavia appendiculata TaxID=2587402 RepID=A0AAN6U2Q3_9PEZI|nr:hypothetical protein N657DRAFT_644250 [Parathielavia appendiculata]
MKLTLLLPLASFWSTAVAAEYFFRFSGSTKYPDINNQRLRSNASDTPGVTLAPHNPADHFSRLAVANPSDPYTPLLVVPTNPHPPPIPGYYGLSDRDGVPNALRLVYTYRPEDEGRYFNYREWHLQRLLGRCGPNGRLVLSYRPVTGAPWRWFAVKEKTPAGIDKWVPWYIKRSPDNEAIMATWEYDTVVIDLAEAGPVNSQAPGGVEE